MIKEASFRSFFFSFAIWFFAISSAKVGPVPVPLLFGRSRDLRRGFLDGGYEELSLSDLFLGFLDGRESEELSLSDLYLGFLDGREFEELSRSDLYLGFLNGRDFEELSLSDLYLGFLDGRESEELSLIDLCLRLLGLDGRAREYASDSADELYLTCLLRLRWILARNPSSSCA
ncbi:MAG: uncharacterized protein KVP18_004104 [Porospora cf. gigantea A]|uniref:uncharacterized protein n=1 Tax=Porospora cf. gigantea A TaxID=2853593 RepID=UPI003559B032|nr:MAG: hypothetical protein KVP18_004104 [Porospora cf. gigantea A]